MLKSDLFMNLFFILFFILIHVEGEEILLEEPPVVLISMVWNIFVDVLYGIVLGVIKLFCFQWNCNVNVPICQ